MRNNDPFARPPRAVHSVGALEDRACRWALKAAGIAPTAVLRAAGLSTSGKLTFDALVAYTDFPFNPEVSTEPLDDVLVLMTRFEKSNLWRAWRSTWIDRPAVRPGERLLIVHGSVTKFAAVYDSPTPPDRPHVSVGYRKGLVLRVEPLASWCHGVGWARADG